MQFLSFFRVTALVLLFFSISAASQDILIKALNVEDGLSQSSVNSITQDQFGITWISTGDGLTSFDGATLKTYYSTDKSKNKINFKNNSIRRVISDSIGNLWVGCDQGILYLDRESNTLNTCFDTITSLANQSCIPLFYSTDTLFVLASRQGIISINIRNQKSKIRFKCTSLSHLNISTINDYEIWFGSFPNKLNRVTFQNGQLKVATFTLTEPHLGMVCQIVKIQENEYLFIGSDQLQKLNIINKTIIPFETDKPLNISHSNIYKCAIRDKKNKFWVALEDGRIQIFNSSLQYELQVRLIKHVEDPSSAFSSPMCLFQDNQGNIWVGSDGQGIALFRPEQLNFNPVRRIKCNDYHIEKPFIRAFEEDPQGRIWIGTYNEGLFVSSITNNQFEHIKPQSDSRFPNLNDIYSLRYLSPHEILAGTSAGLISINPKNFEIKTILGSDNPNLVNKVHQIEIVNPNLILVLSNKTLIKLIKTNMRWIVDREFKAENFHFDYFCLKNDTIYAFGETGITKYAKNLTKISNYRFHEMVINLKVNTAYFDSIERIFWLCTENGLISVNKDAEIQKWYNTGEGLSNHYLYGFLPDKEGNLWISSNGGISRFDKQHETFQNFGYLDGMQSLEFNTGAYFKSKAGEFYFGGINGFNHFYPDSIENNRKSARIILRKILINDEEYNIQPAYLLENGLHLAHFQNTLTFEFQGLDYLNNSGIKYTYFLENWDHEWVSAGRNTQVRYSKLRPGKYIFHVRDARFPHDQNSMLSIQFEVEKPYWRELWFQIPSLVLLITIILLIFRQISTMSMRKRIAQLEEQRRINSIRSRIASDLHDDIGAGLSKLAMISEAAFINKQNDSQADLQNITAKTRQMIDQLRMIVWTLDPPDESLDELIAFMRTKTGELIDQLDIEYRFDAPDSTEIKQISPEFRRNVYYVVREALHNALKHSKCKKIGIKMNLNQALFNIKLEDDGIGFNRQDTRGRGYGLKGMERRIAEINGRISIDSVAGKGTSIQIQIPIQITT